MHDTRSVYNKLLDKFNHLFLLTLSSRQDRTQAEINQLYHIGMKHDDTSLRIHYATPFPHNHVIAAAFNSSNKGRFTKANEYDCSRNHYAMIRQAYDLGYEHCLIMEDDIQFLKNEEIWDEYLQSIPDDWDILQFGGFTADANIDKYLLDENVNKWFTHKDIGIWTTSMYALSRKGMEFYLAFMDKLFWVADGPLYKAPQIADGIIKTYLSKTPLVIQANKDIVSSDIRNESTDSINYENDNLYERHIDKNDYFAYIS